MKSRQSGSNSDVEQAHPKDTVMKSPSEDKSDTSKQSKDKDEFSTSLKLLFCFVGLQVSYIAWGISQEQLMTNEYKLGKFKSSSFCVFGNRVFALIIAMIIVIYKRYVNKTPLKDAPYYYYAPSSLSNSISSWAQYEALKFISFPTQVLSKSCKVIPVMIVRTFCDYYYCNKLSLTAISNTSYTILQVGMLLNKKTYPLIEYAEAVAITAGVAMFTFSEKHHSSDATRVDTYYGAGLLALYLCCDSFTSQWQSKVFKQYGVDQYQMMLGVNIWSIVMTGFTLLQSGEMFSALAFIMSDSQAFAHMTILSVTSATGQLFIFYTIKEFGPVIFTIMMTTRQVFSLFVSCLLFSHKLTALGWIGSLAVFGIVFNRIYRKGSD